MIKLFVAKIEKIIQSALLKCRKKHKKSENLLPRLVVCLNRRFSLWYFWSQLNNLAGKMLLFED